MLLRFGITTSRLGYATMLYLDLKTYLLILNINHEKTMMNGNGSGSIDVTAGDDTWQYEWPELNESVKTTVSLI